MVSHFLLADSCLEVAPDPHTSMRWASQDSVESHLVLIQGDVLIEDKLNVHMVGRKSPVINQYMSDIHQSFNMPIDAFVAKSHILHRALAHEPQKIVSGSGISFTLESGKVVLDASAGPSVSVLGHHQPEVTQAIVDQLGQIAYVYSGSRYTCDAAEELAEELLRDAPGGLTKAILVNSGSEATDAALKLATQYFYEIGQRQRVNFIARKQSYHGNTLGALSISGHESRREYYRPWISSNVTFVDPCYAYRAQGTSETDAQYVSRLKQQLEDSFQDLGPDTVAAFVAETVSGTTLGCVPPVPGYLQAVREVCDKYGALLILDEVSVVSIY
jgi:adenosylmethionine-8-amino-7-oxononanoate aminotransferase